MRSIVTVMLHIATAITLTAFVATSAAATDRLKLLATVNTGVADRGGKDKWIEIQSYQWGRTAKVDSFTVKQGAAPDDHEQEMTIVAGQVASPPPPGGVRVASGDVDADPDGPAIAGNVPNASASKRQHRPMTITKDVDKGTPSATPAEKRQHGWMPSNRPLDRGTVRVKVKFPWTACRVGERFPAAVLENASGRHELNDVTVAACGQDGIALDYARVEVRAWDPKKKEPIAGEAQGQ